MRALLALLALAPALALADTVGYPGGPGAAIDHGTISGLSDDDHTQYVLDSLYDARTILAATSDNTPAALTIAEDRIVGRITGGEIAALTAAQILTLINVEAGADVTDATNVLAALAAAAAPIDLNGQNITDVGTVDGLDLSTVEAGADVTDDANVRAALAAATATIDLNSQTITDVGTVDGVDVSALSTTVSALVTPTCTKFQINGGNGAGLVGDLATSPVTIISAPGSDEYIDFVSVYLFLDFAAAAYDGVAPGIVAKWTNCAGDAVSQSEAGSFLVSATDKPLILRMTTSATNTPVENAPIVLCATTDPYVAAGDSPIRGEACYFERDYTPTP